MAKYIIKETFSSQAAGLMQNPEDCFKVLEPIFKARGCKLE